MYGKTICEARRMGLDASIQLRLDACRRMNAASQNNDGKAHEAAHDLHKYGEKVARIYRAH